MIHRFSLKIESDSHIEPVYIENAIGNAFPMCDAIRVLKKKQGFFEERPMEEWGVMDWIFFAVMLVSIQLTGLMVVAFAALKILYP